MDSLLASYASSDEEEENPNQTSFSKQISISSPLFSAIPPSESSIPQSKLQCSTPNTQDDRNPPKPSSKSSLSLFSSLPQPKTLASQQPILDSKPKKVIQFKPPTSVNPTYVDDDEDEDDEEKEKKRRKQSESMSQSSNVRSFLTSMPAARNSSSFGLLGAAAGSGRRTVFDTESHAPSLGGFSAENDQNKWNHGSDGDVSASYEQSSDQNGGNYVDYSTCGSEASQIAVGGDYDSSYANYEGYSSCGNYGEYGQYSNGWGDQLPVAVLESTGPSESAFRLHGKRGRKDIPTEVIEVKQDELTKNRPREDQVKLTGIAFGPSYQPASTKGKPTKLHKRKHQIGSLYFDMKQKETELAERRAKGFLTKAQTHAKYGW